MNACGGGIPRTLFGWEGIAVSPNLEASQVTVFLESSLFQGLLVVESFISALGAVEDDEIGEHVAGRGFGLESQDLVEGCFGGFRDVDEGEHWLRTFRKDERIQWFRRALVLVNSHG